MWERGREGNRGDLRYFGKDGKEENRGALRHTGKEEWRAEALSGMRGRGSGEQRRSQACGEGEVGNRGALRRTGNGEQWLS